MRHWLLALAFALACGGADSGEHAGRGIVQAVDPAAHQVVLDHEDIPGFMKAMTMTFQVAPDVPLDQVAPGAVVEFRVVEEGGVYTVTEIRPAQ